MLLKRISVCAAFFIAITQTVFSQSKILWSPNNHVGFSLNKGESNWYLSVFYKQNEVTEAIKRINIGLVRNDQDFTNLKFVAAGQKVKIVDNYNTLHGKKSHCYNTAYQQTIQFTNTKGSKINLCVRSYDNGVTFKYEFPDKKSGQYTIQKELTSYEIPDNDGRWIQKFTSSYEDFFPYQKDTLKTGEWGYTALFQSAQKKYFYLISEANVDRNYCSTKLSNKQNTNQYALTFPAASDGNHIGDVLPKIGLPWVSPWRVIIIGQLADVVESTLIEDVSTPNKLVNTDWIKSGSASWPYWAYNRGSKDFKIVSDYIDLAAKMGWPYILIDAEWDIMDNGGNIQDAVKYAASKGIKPLVWYNSGGKHNNVSAGPKDKLMTHESRAKEFAMLNKMGIYGIKVDFFQSDKQDMMKYYIDLMEDAAKYKLMINFHGSTIPKGWSRTYPNLMSMEAVYGSEQYNNQPYMTTKGAEHNVTLPFTRNVIGPMDYTPVGFTNTQHKHNTTFAHELALPVIFESGMLHFADRPSAFIDLPDEPKEFLRHVPVAWDDIKFVDGYPGKKVVLARRKGDIWYIAGLNGLNTAGSTTVNFSFLPHGVKYKFTLIADGDSKEKFDTQYTVVSSESSKTISWLPMGGFAGVLKPM
jgi:alpha-glucosidase